MSSKTTEIRFSDVSGVPRRPASPAPVDGAPACIVRRVRRSVRRDVRGKLAYPIDCERFSICAGFSLRVTREENLYRIPPTHTLSRARVYVCPHSPHTPHKLRPYAGSRDFAMSHGSPHRTLMPSLARSRARDFLFFLPCKKKRVVARSAQDGRPFAAAGIHLRAFTVRQLSVVSSERNSTAQRVGDAAASGTKLS